MKTRTNTSLFSQWNRSLRSGSIAALTFVAFLGSHALAGNAAFKIEIQRKYSGKDCVSGYLLINGKPVCYVLEKPWKNNLPEISSVPVGEYDALIRADGTKGWRIELRGVPKRTNVQIHIGNTVEDSVGCLLPGKEIDSSLCKVLQSGAAMELLRTSLSEWEKSLQQSVMIRVKISEG